MVGIYYPRSFEWVLREAETGLQYARGKVNCRVSKPCCEGWGTYAYFSACFTAVLEVTASAEEYPTSADLLVMVTRAGVPACDDGAGSANCS